MANFDIAAYNELPKISVAHHILRKQLANDKPGRLDALINALSHLFLTGDERFKFGICIMHRHFDLKDGERMVTQAVTDEESPNIVAIVQPSTDTSSNIVADRWMFDGKEFEHTVVPDPASITPPSDEFFEEFRRICRSFGNGVDILGICANYMSVIQPYDVLFLELLHPDTTKERTQVIEQVARTDFVQTRSMQQSAWVPVASLSTDGASDSLVSMNCAHNCQEHWEYYEVPAGAEISFEREIAPAFVVGSRSANQF